MLLKKYSIGFFQNQCTGSHWVGRRPRANLGQHRTQQSARCPHRSLFPQPVPAPGGSRGTHRPGSRADGAVLPPSDSYMSVGTGPKPAPDCQVGLSGPASPRAGDPPSFFADAENLGSIPNSTLVGHLWPVFNPGPEMGTLASYPRFQQIPARTKSIRKYNDPSRKSTEPPFLLPHPQQLVIQTRFEDLRPGFESQLCHILTVWPQGSYNLGLSFLFRQMETVTVPTTFGKDEGRQCLRRAMPGTFSHYSHHLITELFVPNSWALSTADFIFSHLPLHLVQTHQPFADPWTHSSSCLRAFAPAERPARKILPHGSPPHPLSAFNYCHLLREAFPDHLI